MKNFLVMMVCLLPFSGFAEDPRVLQALENMECDIQIQKGGKRVEVDLTDILIHRSKTDSYLAQLDMEEKIQGLKDLGKDHSHIKLEDNIEFTKTMREGLHLGRTVEGDVIVFEKKSGKIRSTLYACDRHGLDSLKSSFLRVPVLSMSEVCNVDEVTAVNVFLGDKSDRFGAFQLGFFPINMMGTGYEGNCDMGPEYYGIDDSEKNKEIESSINSTLSLKSLAISNG